MHFLVYIFAFVVGTVFGSFLNVVAYRSLHGGSIVSGRSQCPHCKKPLKANDLIPIASYLLLNGKCRYCHKPISLQYPIVEFATGILFAYTIYHWFGGFPFSSSSVLYLAFLLFVVSVFIVLFITDLKEGLLPNSLVLTSITAVLAFNFIFLLTGFYTPLEIVYGLLAACSIAFIFFAIVFLTGERAMGGGDIKLVFLIAIILGWPVIIVGLLAGFLTGGLVAVMLILIGKKRFGQTVPLGPFLIVGAFIALFWGQQIMESYLNLLLT